MALLAGGGGDAKSGVGNSGAAVFGVLCIMAWLWVTVGDSGAGEGMRMSAWFGFFFKISLMWTIFKVFIEFVTILLLFCILFFWLRGVWAS